MSAIARLYLHKGIKVSGCDVKENSIMRELKNSGAHIFIGHNPAHLDTDIDTVVYSSAIRQDCPEFSCAIARAKSKGLKLLRRAEALAELMEGQAVITVAGSHGKTTTSSLVSFLLCEAGLSPTAAIGGVVHNFNTNSLAGAGKFFIAEADESDGSFLCYRPSYSIITNIDREHLDYYKDFSSEIEVFKKFINQTEKNGCVFACSDDKILFDLANTWEGRKIFFGLKESEGFYPRNIKINGLSSSFDCYCGKQFIGSFNLNLGGAHNISNALAVIALGVELNIKPDVILKALAGYQGAGRRLEVKFKDDNYIFIDDYAHHPTEIRATLAAARSVSGGRLVVIFQPHRYSRTKILMDEFAKSFSLADYLVLTDIYPASELPMEGVSGEILFEKIRLERNDKPIVFLQKEKIAGHILEILKPKDLVITLGAGDIVKVCDELAKNLQNTCTA